MTSSHSISLLGVILLLALTSAARQPRGRMVRTTAESLPAVAEATGAANYEEVEEPSTPQGRRVQRKLPQDEETATLDQQTELMEYQGVMGRPGVDFPVLPSIPRTDFNCRAVKSSGYYADLDTGCQVFHICDGGRKISFLCPNGTIFRQSHLICDWWFRVDCGKSPEQYEESAELLAHDQMQYRRRAAEAAKAGHRPGHMMRSETNTEDRLQQVEEAARSKAPRRKPVSRPPVTSTTTTTTPKIVTVRQEEREHQVLAETASFVGNRHRFNTFSEPYNRNAFSSAPSSEGTNSVSSQPTHKPVLNSLNDQPTQKPVFTIRVKPNRQFSFVELERPALFQPASTPQPYQSVQFLTSRVVEPVRNSHSTPYQLFDSTPATTELPPFINRTELDYVRPEAVNSLMEAEAPYLGTPTPATAVKALQSLASYLQSTTTTTRHPSRPAVSEILLRAHSGSPDSSPELDELPATPAPQFTHNDSVLPSVLTKATQESYSYLFSDPKPKSAQLSSHPEVETNSLEEKETTTKKHTKENTDLRELAQVFTRALSAYLEDPESFKEILAQVRPTAPSSVEVTTASPDDEVLAFSDDQKETDRATTAADITPSDINNLAAGLKQVENDNSLEAASPETQNYQRPETYSSRYSSSTAAPTSILYDINNIAVNNTGEYYSSVGSSEDRSYFPTAGGVNDPTRPRYGGFHNNSNYKPYGSELPLDVTGAPVTDAYPPTTMTYDLQSRQDAVPGPALDLPEALDVNNLANTLYTEPSFSAELTAAPYQSSVSETFQNQPLGTPAPYQNEPLDTAAPYQEAENLHTAGTQSFVAANNYIRFGEKDKTYYDAPISAPLTREESKSINDQAEVEVTTFHSEESTEAAITYDSTTPEPEYTTVYDKDTIKYQNVNLGNGVTLERTVNLGVARPEVTWSIGTTPEDVEVRPTTYHPVRPDRATDHPLFIPPEPQLEVQAKRMFGGLNETMAGRLMNAMHQVKGKEDTPIRRLVLLLVSDPRGDNATVEESRDSLIRALLSEEARQVQPDRQGKSLRTVEGETSLGWGPTDNKADLFIPPSASPHTASSPDHQPYDSDARAVELLKSLYNLAAKWG